MLQIHFKIYFFFISTCVCVCLSVCHPVVAFKSTVYYFFQLKDLWILSFPSPLLHVLPRSLNCVYTPFSFILSATFFFFFLLHPSLPALLPSSNVVALISVLDGPVPALLKAWTTTPYWANFFRLSRVYTSLSPVAFISTMLYWPLLPGPFSL